MIFITNESAQLKVFIRRTLHSKLLQFAYLSKTEKVSLSGKNYDIKIEISDIKSVEDFAILLYINQIIIGKFQTQGIITSEVKEDFCKTIVLTRNGKIYLEFSTGMFGISHLDMEL